MSKAKLKELLNELKKEYLVAIPQKIEILKALNKQKNLVDLTSEYHKLKGTGKTYGFPEVSTITSLMEELCNQKHPEIFEISEVAVQLLENLHSLYLKEEYFNLEQNPKYKILLLKAKKI